MASPFSTRSETGILPYIPRIQLTNAQGHRWQASGKTFVCYYLDDGDLMVAQDLIGSTGLPKNGMDWFNFINSAHAGYFQKHDDETLLLIPGPVQFRTPTPTQVMPKPMIPKVNLMPRPMLKERVPVSDEEYSRREENKQRLLHEKTIAFVFRGGKSMFVLEYPTNVYVGVFDISRVHVWGGEKKVIFNARCSAMIVGRWMV
jgi:hypothetical protein